MKNALRISRLFTLSLLAAVLMLAGCGKKSLENFEFNEAYSAYISAFSTGKISRTSSIVVRLNRDVVETDQVNVVVAEPPFEISPNVPGKATWTDRRTIEFLPDEPLPSNTQYAVSFMLGNIFENVPKELNEFEFPVETMEQAMEVVVTGSETTDEKELKWQAISGMVTTADFEFSEKVEEAMKANQAGRKLKIHWTHDLEGRNHRFRVDSVSRGVDPSKVELAWKGKAINASQDGQREVEIPALGDFSVSNITVTNSPEQYISIFFSDPVSSRQSLNGLISMENTTLRFTFNKNEVRAYPSSRMNGSRKLEVSTGIKNVLGHKLQEGRTFDVAFEQMKPEVKLIGSGTIVPRSNGKIPFAFEAVSLKSVQVRVMRIYEDNILQFLQVNDFDGSYEINRVGKEVASKHVELDEEKRLDLHQWNRHVVDLSELIEAEPGAIYRITIDFGPRNSIYECDEGDQAEADDELYDPFATAASDEENEDSFWDYYEDEYSYSEEWENRDNPCHPAYYSYYERGQSRNILASDLGIIGKRGTDGSMIFAVSDLNTTKPMSGVQISLYDYQQQILLSGSTGSDGKVSLDMEEKPIFLVAQKGAQKGYLKLDDAYSMSLSKFDVGGNQYFQGVKGYLYGERGVWRPGDSLYLTFILEDKLESLPEDHPVSFTLFNPRGQRVNRQVKTLNTNGFYTFPVATSAEAPTGNYRAVVAVGGAKFEKNLKIETVMPNRLKIKIDFGKEAITAEDGEINGNMSATWLHGAIADGLEADVNVKLTSVPTKFSTYTDYNFDDPVRYFSPESYQVFSGQLDNDGAAKVPVKLNVNEEAPGMLQASFTTRVFEPSGNFSTDQFSIPYYPYEKFVGIKLPKGDKTRGMILTDQDHKVDIAVVNGEGKPVSGQSKVTMELYKLDWKWWWDKSAGNVSSYNSRFYQEKLQTEEVTVNNGNGQWKLRVNYPQWGRYLVRACDENGHCTGKIVYIDWPGWAGRAQDENPGGASMLTFSVDKPKCETGEKITLKIPTGMEGRAFVSIESGSRVIQSEWVESQGDMTTYSFTATEEMTPNIYAHVTLIQPHNQTANDRPMRLYGIMPIEVVNPKTVLAPKITMANVLEPMSKVTVKVSEATGKPMTYTVAVVDEGLLDLTRFQTPNPWNIFYAREALDVKTWDMYDKVAGAYGFDITKMLAIGGDGTMPGKEGTKQNRFKPVVKYLGPFELKAGETATHDFRMPNYVGSVRTMVVAGQDGAYGAAEKATPVRKPLMILGTMPRVVGPEEEIKFPVSVFAMEEQVKNVSLTLETNDLFAVNGQKTKNISFSRPGDELITFDLKVAPKIGKGTVKVTAKSGSEVAVYDIDVIVRNPNPRVTNVYEEAIDAARAWTKSFTYPGMAGTNKGVIEISSIPPMNLGKRLNYLVQYPHGCIEQTTSSVFAQIYLGDLMDLTKEKEMEIDKNLRAGIQRLSTFQLASGGMSYWPGNGEPSDWGTNYAGNFLIECKKKGYRLPDGFLNKWISFQTTQANAWTSGKSSDELIQADRLFLLALAGSPQLGAMNRFRERSNLSNTAKWRLAAAYKLAGQPETATRVSNMVSTDVIPYTELGGSYGSELRDKAIILECLSILGDRAKGAELAKQISKGLASQDYMSTQTTGYCLIAMAKFAGKASGSDSGLNVAYRIGKGSWTNLTSQKPVAMIDLPANAAGLEIEVQNKGNAVIFSRVVASGVPLHGTETASESNLNMNVRYLDLDGNLISVDRLEQGTDFVAEITMSNPGTRGDLEELALTQIFPSGWEIHNPRMSGEAFTKPTSAPEYQDIRDDRVYTYFDLMKSKYGYLSNSLTKTFRVQLNAAYLGKFYLPAVNAEAMYDATINARTAGRWVEVVKDTGI